MYALLRRLFNQSAERRYWLALAQAAHVRNPLVRADVILYILAYVAPSYARHRLYRLEDILQLAFAALVLAVGYLLSNAGRTVRSHARPHAFRQHS
ncbi:unnamed protein product [Amoebophrya sp. A120]|nr:unnamed protein product [Amoebophrya sp. A120]|eukprot:GSA120T00021695001.1